MFKLKTKSLIFKKKTFALNKIHNIFTQKKKEIIFIFFQKFTSKKYKHFLQKQSQVFIEKTKYIEKSKFFNNFKDFIKIYKKIEDYSQNLNFNFPIFLKQSNKIFKLRNLINISLFTVRLLENSFKIEAFSKINKSFIKAIFKFENSIFY